MPMPKKRYEQACNSIKQDAVASVKVKGGLYLKEMEQ